MHDACTEKIIIPTNECASGMILMQPVLDENTGAVIIPRGEVLGEEHIIRLKNFKHTQIWVKITPESDFWKVKDVSYIQYQQYAQTLRNAFGSGQTTFDRLNLNKLDELAKNIVKDFQSDYELMGCMSLLPKLEKNIYYHSVNIAFLALLVGRWQNYDKEKLEKLVLTALLHDVGKLMINSSLFSKREDQMELSEKLEYRRHTIYGYEMLVPFNELDNEVLKGVLSHHECMDGSGFPLSIQAERINEFARVIAIVDTYDRLKEKYQIFEAIRHLGSLKLKKFAPDMVLQFCSNVVNFYVGCKVVLSNGRVGEVMMIQPEALYKPIVKIDGQYVNLYEQTSIHIREVL